MARKHTVYVFLPDIQGVINWEELQKVQNAPFPVRFVFMKASEGGDFSDTAFVRNFERARRHGFIRGAYHFFNPKTDAARQADFFIRSVKLEPGDLPPVLDIEKVGDDEEALRRGVKTWLRLIERHYRVKPILYASYKFKEGEWRFWQHTDGGKLPGIREQVDLNVFNGTLDDLKHMTILPDSAFHKS